MLAAWPRKALWGEWLDRFAAFAPMVLKQPDRVLHVLQELRPMSEMYPLEYPAEVGPMRAALSTMSLTD